MPDQQEPLPDIPYIEGPRRIAQPTISPDGRTIPPPPPTLQDIERQASKKRRRNQSARDRANDLQMRAEHAAREAAAAEEMRSKIPPDISPEMMQYYRQKALLLATVANNPYIPDDVKQKITPKQVELLVHEGRECLFGGAARGGKSYGMLLAACQYLTEPGYNALILRRTFTQMDKSESIYRLAEEWWGRDKRVKFMSSSYKFTFKQYGSVLEFGHMQTVADRQNYQGSSYQFIGFDELTQFEEPQYTYLFSRQSRKEDSKLPLRMRATSNPGGIGHAWVKKRFIDPRTRKPGASFIPALLTDNPNVDQESYRVGLMELPWLERNQLLTGNWDAVESGRFSRQDFRYFSESGVMYTLHDSIDIEGALNKRQWHRDKILFVFQTVDTAATVNKDSDFTVISTWAVTPDWCLLWLDCRRFKAEIPDIIPAVAEAYADHSPQFVAIESGGNPAVYQACRRLQMVVKEFSPGGIDKIARATEAINLVADRRVFVPEHGQWVEDAVGEVCRFTGKSHGRDDVVDSLSMAAKLMMREQDDYGDGEYGVVLSEPRGFWSNKQDGLAAIAREVPLIVSPDYYREAEERRGRFGGIYG